MERFGFWNLITSQENCLVQAIISCYKPITNTMNNDGMKACEVWTVIFSCQLGTCILFHVFYWHIYCYPSFRLQITHCALFILLVSGPFYTKFAVSGNICWKPSGPARGTNILNWVLLISFSKAAVFNALAWSLWDWVACNFLFIMSA